MLHEVAELVDRAQTAAQNGSAIIDYQLYGYVGGTTDTTTGLQHFGRRWYDPTTGRFTQQDDIQTLADPNRANRYTYAGDNPINYVDPTGRISGSFSGQVCFGLCVGLSYNGDGTDNSIGFELGAGTPSASYNGEFSSSGVPSGGANQPYLKLGCGVGIVTASVQVQQSGVSAGGGLGVNTGGCSATVGVEIPLG